MDYKYKYLKYKNKYLQLKFNQYGGYMEYIEKNVKYKIYDCKDDKDKVIPVIENILQTLTNKNVDYVREYINDMFKKFNIEMPINFDYNTESDVYKSYDNIYYGILSFLNNIKNNEIKSEPNNKLLFIVAEINDIIVGNIFLWRYELNFAMQYIMKNIFLNKIIKFLPFKINIADILLQCIQRIIQSKNGKYLFVKPINKMIDILKARGFNDTRDSIILSLSRPLFEFRWKNHPIILGTNHVYVFYKEFK